LRSQKVGQSVLVVDIDLIVGILTAQSIQFPLQSGVRGRPSGAQREAARPQLGSPILERQERAAKKSSFRFNFQLPNLIDSRSACDPAPEVDSVLTLTPLTEESGILQRVDYRGDLEAQLLEVLSAHFEEGQGLDSRGDWRPPNRSRRDPDRIGEPTTELGGDRIRPLV